MFAASIWFSPCSLLAGTWTILKPVDNTSYPADDIPIDVTYDWGTGTAVTLIEVLIEDTNGNEQYHQYHTATNSNPTPTSIKMTARAFLQRLVPSPNLAVKVTFTAKDALGNTVSTSNPVPFKVTPP